MRKIIAAVFVSMFLTFPARAETWLNESETLDFMGELQTLLQQSLDRLRTDATPEQLARWPEKASMEFVCTYISRFVSPGFICPQVFVEYHGPSPAAPSQKRAVPSLS